MLLTYWTFSARVLAGVHAISKETQLRWKTMKVENDERTRCLTFAIAHRFHHVKDSCVRKQAQLVCSFVVYAKAYMFTRVLNDSSKHIGFDTTFVDKYVFYHWSIIVVSAKHVRPSLAWGHLSYMHTMHHISKFLYMWRKFMKICAGHPYVYYWLWCVSTND